MHLLGEPAVHLEEVAGEQGRLVAAGPRADLDDHRGMARRRPDYRRACPGEFSPSCSMPGAKVFELRLGIRSHLGIGLAGKELLGLGDLTTQLEVTAVRDRDLGERTAFLRQGRDPSDVGGDLGIEQHPLDLQESLIVRLKLLEHGSFVR